METEMDTQPERRDSNARRRSGGSDGAVAAAVANLPITLGAPGDKGAAYEELETPTAKEGAQSRRLPHLRDYNLYVSWYVYVGAFFFSAIRQGICNYLTASGIAGTDSIGLQAVVKSISTFGVIMGGMWIALIVVGGPWRMRIIKISAVAGTILYSVVFAISQNLAALTLLPIVFVSAAVGMIWSERRCFATVFVACIAILQIILTFIITSLPQVSSTLPETVGQFLVPALKTFYVGFTSEVLTAIWKKMYQRPCSPYALTAILLLVLVNAETMGVVGLLAAVDSSNPWQNAAIFCTTTIVMETNSRSGLFMSMAFKLMGKKYRFSDAAHIFRWGKMWASYCWVCVFTGFVVPALILGLRAKDSNFTFLRWQVWVLAGIYIVQQMVTDFCYVYVQNYIRPSQTLSQTASRCLVLGEATPFSGENEHIGVDGGLQSPKSPKEDELEPAWFKLGPFTITVEALLTFLLFEYTVSVWNNYVRGQFGSCGTFLPSDDGSCD